MMLALSLFCCLLSTVITVCPIWGKVDFSCDILNVVHYRCMKGNITGMIGPVPVKGIIHDW